MYLVNFFVFFLLAAFIHQRSGYVIKIILVSILFSFISLIDSSILFLIFVVVVVLVQNQQIISKNLKQEEKIAKKTRWIDKYMVNWIWNFVCFWIHRVHWILTNNDWCCVVVFRKRKNINNVKEIMTISYSLVYFVRVNNHYIFFSIYFIESAPSKNVFSYYLEDFLKFLSNVRK